jgi:hypothetical protein
MKVLLHNSTKKNNVWDINNSSSISNKNKKINIGNN